MTLRSFSVALLGVLAALAGCRIEKPATVVPKPPTIASFTSSASSVASGDQVTLSWETSDATSIELRETSSGELAVPAEALTGSFQVTIDRTSLFVLVARGPGGSDARAVSVQLVGQTLGELTLQAIPPVIPGGASSTLAWTAPGASQVSITAGGQPLELVAEFGARGELHLVATRGEWLRDALRDPTR